MGAHKLSVSKPTGNNRVSFLQEPYGEEMYPATPRLALQADSFEDDLVSASTVSSPAKVDIQHHAVVKRIQG